MTERSYLFLVGALILLALYLDNTILFYGLALTLLLEGVSGIRLTRIIQALRQVSLHHNLTGARTKRRFAICGLSAWRVLTASMLVLSHILVPAYDHEMTWFIPWFMGFAIMGAGVSGFCPVLIGLQRVGFK